MTELHNLNLRFTYFHYISGAYGECFVSGTKVHCVDKFMRKPLNLWTDTRGCRKPAKFEITLSILGETFYKVYDGNQDIPLGLSIPRFGEFVLRVDANPFGNGDLQLKVRRRCI